MWFNIVLGHINQNKTSTNRQWYQAFSIMFILNYENSNVLVPSGRLKQVFTPTTDSYFDRCILKYIYYTVIILI